MQSVTTRQRLLELAYNLAGFTQRANGGYRSMLCISVDK